MNQSEETRRKVLYKMWLLQRSPQWKTFWFQVDGQMSTEMSNTISWHQYTRMVFQHLILVTWSERQTFGLFSLVWSTFTGGKVPQTRLQTNAPECSQTQIKLNQGSVLLRPYNVWTTRRFIFIGTHMEHLKLVMIQILEWQRNQPSQVVFCLIFTGTRGDPEETSDYVNENPHSASGTNINNWHLSYWLMCIWKKPQLKLHHIIIKYFLYHKYAVQLV